MGSEQFNPPSRFIKEIPDEWSSSLRDGTTQVYLPTDELSRARHFLALLLDSGAHLKMITTRDYQIMIQTSLVGIWAGGGLSKGTKSSSPTFGVGSIFQTEGNGEQQKVSVLFTDKQSKNLLPNMPARETLVV